MTTPQAKPLQVITINADGETVRALMPHRLFHQWLDASSFRRVTSWLVDCEMTGNCRVAVDVEPTFTQFAQSFLTKNETKTEPLCSNPSDTVLNYIHNQTSSPNTQEPHMTPNDAIIAQAFHTADAISDQIVQLQDENTKLNAQLAELGAENARIRSKILLNKAFPATGNASYRLSPDSREYRILDANLSNNYAKAAKLRATIADNCAKIAQLQNSINNVPTEVTSMNTPSSETSPVTFPVATSEELEAPAPLRKNDVLVNILCNVTDTISELTVLDGLDELDGYCAQHDLVVESIDGDPDEEYGWYCVVSLAPPSDDVDDIAPETPVSIDDAGYTPNDPIQTWTEVDDTDEAPPAPVPPVKAPKAKKAKKAKKQPVHFFLRDIILASPGINRTTVFAHAALRSACLKASVITLIDAGDKMEVKRWNRRLNRFIRQIRRDGHDIQIVRTNNVAAYTIPAIVQLPLVFDTEAAAPIIEQEAAPPVKVPREEEPEMGDTSFESLLSMLDDDAVSPITSETAE